MAYLLHHYLEAAAASTPDAPAVRDGGRTFSYADVRDGSARVRAELEAVGVGTGDRVVLWAGKIAETICALYGILSAGAAYVPVDPASPVGRAGLIVGSVRPAALIVDEAVLAAAGHVFPAGLPVFVLAPDRPLRMVSPGSGARGPDRRTVERDLAYILHTSGSTGVPKGVMLTHRNATAFVDWAVRAFGIGGRDVLSSHAPLHFDLSVLDVFAAARAGAALVLVPPSLAMFPSRLVDFVRAQGVTVWYSVPSVLSGVVTRAAGRLADLDGLRWILFAGEVFTPRHLADLMAALPASRFANLYGPTETNVCTWYEVTEPPPGPDPTPIGRPTDNDEVLLVTADGRLAGPGEVGEIHVRGATVMAGYWGDPERTARTLVPNPLTGDPDDRCYRTGDWASARADGELVLVGRRDDQIKTRGYRVELGEVEHALLAHPAVAECAVVAVPHPVLTHVLCAFVSVTGDVSGPALGAHALDVLPQYMVPARFEFLEALPRNANGKVDRVGLRDLAHVEG
ncbi:amino acid adenylation domain-containing protein [Longispora urticae]